MRKRCGNWFQTNNSPPPKKEVSGGDVFVWTKQLYELLPTVIRRFLFKGIEVRELPWLPKILKQNSLDVSYVPKIFKSQHITHHQSIINYHLVPIKKTRKLWVCVPPWLALNHLSGMFLFRCMNCIGIVKIQWMPSCNTSPRRVCL